VSVAAFIDVQPTEQDLATELAITLAEFCVAENEALFLMADRITALEIGISLIGASESRTVEDSDHRVSTIVLLHSFLGQTLWTMKFFVIPRT
jgi:hypothetical protein